MTVNSEADINRVSRGSKALSHAERLLALFAGLERAYGQTRVPKNARPDPTTKKVEATCFVIHEPPTADQWRKHLDGLVGFGAYALRDDGTCSWGAIDIDDYSLDQIAVLNLVTRLGLPLIVVRTKSGGTHCFLFVSEPAPAKLVRRKLKEWALALGCSPKVEIFPKHDAMTVDIGNYINMPYYGRHSLRYAVGKDGSLTVEEFLDLAEASRIGVNELEAWQTLAPMPEKADPNLPVIDDDFDGEATGLEDVGDDEIWLEGKGDDYWRELAHGLGDGNRHNGLKALAGLLFGRLEPNLAEVLVRLFAEHQCDPPMTRVDRRNRINEPREVTDIIKWTLKRELGR
jgi:TOTE conflict system, Archaeo-Eukaryotic Primase domain